MDLLNKITSQGKCEDAICVNDLEAPAFSKLPELQALKDKLRGAGTAGVSSVFMSGSGSTIVQVGSDVVPEFVREDEADWRARYGVMKDSFKPFDVDQSNLSFPLF